MTKQEYIETIERCKKALDSTSEYTFATPEARNAAVNAIRLNYELSRELYRLDNDIPDAV